MITNPSDMLTAYREAIDALDVDALLALYEPDAHPFDAFAWRVDDWPGQVRGWVGNMQLSSGTRVEEVEVVEGDGHIAGLSAVVRYAGVDPDGNDHSIGNRLTWVLRRGEDGWRIAQEHTSVPLRMRDEQPDLRPTD